MPCKLRFAFPKPLQSLCCAFRNGTVCMGSLTLARSSFVCVCLWIILHRVSGFPELHKLSLSLSTSCVPYVSVASLGWFSRVLTLLLPACACLRSGCCHPDNIRHRLSPRLLKFLSLQVPKAGVIGTRPKSRDTCFGSEPEHMVCSRQ